MLYSIIYGLCHDWDGYTEVLQKYPPISITNSQVVRKVFEDKVRKMLLISQIIDDYNQNMNGVDRADHLRSSIVSHRVGNRTWLPLLYWLLDVTKTNSYLLYKHHYEEKLSAFYRDLPEKMLAHREFQEELALQLIQDGYQIMKGHRQSSDHDTLERVLVRPTTRFSSLHCSLPPSRTQLPVERFRTNVIHYPVRSTRGYCLWCKHQINTSKRPVLATLHNNTISIPKHRTKQTSFKCSVCKVPLCQINCFESFHKP